MPVERDEVGRKIDYPGLTYAPINEQGVVLLFGMMSDDLGFSVETIRSAFPDALVVDYRENPNRGVKKYIEFEFVSSHFGRQKGHDPAKCDIIVCWEHDWKNHPENIEVIELKSEIQKLKRAEAEPLKETIANVAATLTKMTKDSRGETRRIRRIYKGLTGGDYQNSWTARLEWVDPGSRTLVERLIQRLTAEVPGLVHQPRYRWYSFYRGEPLTERNQVAVILMGKKHVRLAIRTNSAKFSDPFKLSNPVGKWFFPKGSVERRMPVTTENLEAVVSIARTAITQLD